MVLIDPLGRLVLVQRANGKQWGLPAGGVTPGDNSLLEAALREMAEETARYVTVVPPRGSWPAPVTYLERHPNGTFSVGFVFKAETATCLPPDGVALPSGGETIRVKAFTPDELWDLMEEVEAIYRPALNGLPLFRHLQRHELLVDAKMMLPDHEEKMLEACGFNDLKKQYGVE
jgi:8-oxo-dGTP pyrophosphatase MutT (NUDIX family)